MSEENKAIVRKFMDDFWKDQKIESADEHLAEDFVAHNLDPQLPPNREGVKMFGSMFQSAFPDGTMAVEDQVAEGDRVVTRWSGRATHTGELFGIPATGKVVSVSGIEIARIANGKIAESWGEFDTMGLMQQLGAVPAPGG